MRLFGILLIVLILLAGGGYTYLALQDYKGRQQINAAGLRHLLVLQGLPLEGEDFAAEDETPFRVEMAGGESTKTVSKKLLESYFKDNTAPTAAPTATPGVEPAAAARPALATNAAVTNQLAEVRRVFGLLKGELDKAAGAQKVALAGGWVLLQAETLDERARIQALVAPAGAGGAAKSAEQVAADAEELAHRLDRQFYRVAPKLYAGDGDATLAPDRWKTLPDRLKAAQEKADAAKKKVADAGAAATYADQKEAADAADEVAWLKLPEPPADAAARRARLAHLLTHLDPDAAWQKRVSVVVGLRRYVGAVATQAARFSEMKKQVELPLPRDQASFQQQQDLLLTEARQNLDKSRAVAEDKARRREQKSAADDAVAVRRTQIKDLTAQLQKVRAEVDELLVRQTGIEKDLYEIQREVGLTLEEVYRLDALLADVERERYGIPPRPRP